MMFVRETPLFHEISARMSGRASLQNLFRPYCLLGRLLIIRKLDQRHLYATSMAFPVVPTTWRVIRWLDTGDKIGA